MSLSASTNSDETCMDKGLERRGRHTKAKVRAKPRRSRLHAAPGLSEKEPDPMQQRTLRGGKREIPIVSKQRDVELQPDRTSGPVMSQARPIGYVDVELAANA